MTIVELALDEVTRGKVLFQNPLKTPVMYRRYILRWIEDHVNSSKEPKPSRGSLQALQHVMKIARR